MTARHAMAQAREALDRRLIPLGPASRYAPPRLGWIGLCGTHSACRPRTWRSGWASAAHRCVPLKTMKCPAGSASPRFSRAAAAMDCTLVYAFIPNESLEGTVRRQAQWVLRQQMCRVSQTMALEAQEADMFGISREAQLRRIVGSWQLWSRSAGSGGV